MEALTTLHTALEYNNTAQYDAIKCNTIQCNKIQIDTLTQYHHTIRSNRDILQLSKKG